MLVKRQPATALQAPAESLPFVHSSYTCGSLYEAAQLSAMIMQIYTKTVAFQILLSFQMSLWTTSGLRWSGLWLTACHGDTVYIRKCTLKVQTFTTTLVYVYQLQTHYLSPTNTYFFRQLAQYIFKLYNSASKNAYKRIPKIELLEQQMVIGEQTLERITLPLFLYVTGTCLNTLKARRTQLFLRGNSPKDFLTM